MTDNGGSGLWLEGSSADVADVLRQRAESLAQESIDEVKLDLVGLLLFRLDEEWYSVKVQDVREIYREYKIAPIPCTPPAILGVVNIRGEMISVTDISRLLGLERSAMGFDLAPAIVIHNKEVTTAIVVEEIGDIVEVPQESIEPPLSIIDKVGAQLIIGSVHLDGRLVGIINASSILEPIGSAQ